MSATIDQMLQSVVGMKVFLGDGKFIGKVQRVGPDYLCVGLKFLGLWPLGKEKTIPKKRIESIDQNIICLKDSEPSDWGEPTKLDEAEIVRMKNYFML